MANFVFPNVLRVARMEIVQHQKYANALRKVQISKFILYFLNHFFFQICVQGFSLSSLTGKCEAVCRSGCQNGNCIAPDVCECKKGYSKVDGVCQPVCLRCIFITSYAYLHLMSIFIYFFFRGCQNGICSAPEICTCSGNGWSLDSTGTKCIASCDKTCLNGFCTG